MTKNKDENINVNIIFYKSGLEKILQLRLWCPTKVMCTLKTIWLILFDNVHVVKRNVKQRNGISAWLKCLCIRK